MPREFLLIFQYFLYAHILAGGLTANTVLNTVSISYIVYAHVMYSLENSLLTKVFCRVDKELFNHFSIFGWLCFFLLFAVRKMLLTFLYACLFFRLGVTGKGCDLFKRFSTLKFCQVAL